jgi:rfaE bifunctional protein kinase chain/domain
VITCRRAEELIAHFNTKQVLVIGDVMLDHYVFGSVDRLNPEAPIPLLDMKTETNSTGGAGNVAKNAAQLGATVTLLSVVGEDHTAEHLKAAASAEGYTLHAVSDSSRPTPCKTRFLAGSQQLLRVDHEVRTEIGPAHEREMIRLITLHATECDAILVSDYAKGVVTKRIAAHILGIAKVHAILVAVDGKPSALRYFKGAAFMSPNRKEACEALGLPEAQSLQPIELAERFAEEFETTACITLSADGMIAVGPDQAPVQVPQTYVREVFDVSGAGDTAIVTTLLARLSGATWEEALQLANTAAAVVIAKIGTVGLSADELVDVICQ